MSPHHRIRPLVQTTMIALTGVALLISSCGGGPAPATPTPADSDGLSFQPIVTATGELVPYRWAELSAAATAEVEALLVELGDHVEEGQLLLRLSGHETAAARLAAAELELLQAEQALAELKENADLDRSRVELELANAREALDDAEYLNRVRQQGNRASQATLDEAEARLVIAEDQLDKAQAAFDRVAGRPSDSVGRALALQELAGAREERDAALRSLNWFKGSPDEIDQALLDADVAEAQARVQTAELTLERMQNGPDQRLLAQAEGRVNNAQAQVDSAQAALADLEVVAPFAGTVSELNVREREWVSTGAPIVVLGDLSSMKVETTDLNEIDAARVSIGDGATVAFDALPELTVEGEVLSLAPKSSGEGGVNYAAVIGLDQVPAGLLWGMTAFVDIEVSQ